MLGHSLVVDPTSSLSTSRVRHKQNEEAYRECQTREASRHTLSTICYEASLQTVDQKAFMDELRCMYYLKVVGLPSIIPSVNTMQLCNEYNYAHYEFHYHSVLHTLNPCFSQIWLRSLQISHAHS